MSLLQLVLFLVAVGLALPALAYLVPVDSPGWPGYQNGCVATELAPRSRGCAFLSPVRYARTRFSRGFTDYEWGSPESYDIVGVSEDDAIADIASRQPRSSADAGNTWRSTLPARPRTTAFPRRYGSLSGEE